MTDGFYPNYDAIIRLSAYIPHLRQKPMLHPDNFSAASIARKISVVSFYFFFVFELEMWTYKIVKNGFTNIKTGPHTIWKNSFPQPSSTDFHRKVS
jgi:hypothetical protein